jgi:hypothetical protein
MELLIAGTPLTLAGTFWGNPLRMAGRGRKEGFGSWGERHHDLLVFSCLKNNLLISKFYISHRKPSTSQVQPSHLAFVR